MNLGTDGFFFHCTVTCLAKCQVRCIAVPLGDEISKYNFLSKDFIYQELFLCAEYI